MGYPSVFLSAAFRERGCWLKKKKNSIFSVVWNQEKYLKNSMVSKLIHFRLPCWSNVLMSDIKTKNKKIRSLNVNIFCLEHFYTIWYNTIFHTFLCSTTYQKLVFYAGIPLTWSDTIWLKRDCQHQSESSTSSNILMICQPRGQLQSRS